MDPLADFSPDPGASLHPTIQRALHLARHLQRRATALQTAEERRQQEELDRMLHNPRDKATLTQLTDQAFRSTSAARATDQFIHILDVQGIPRFFSVLDRTLLRGFQNFGSLAPEVAIPLVKAHLQKETANVILPAEQDILREHLEARRSEGVRMNVNFLGEAILSEAEAERRLLTYLSALERPEIEVVSVKISTLYSQISPLAREHTLAVLADRLDLLYRTAARYTFTHRDGRTVPKFVYLDMEEYRDMTLTAEVFMRVLDRPGLEQLPAGIVLQSYIPDSYRVQRILLDWARKRHQAGKAPITLRIVKGANMEMERLEASLRGWPQAPYLTKAETDANYKRLIREALQPHYHGCVRLGVASHNLFELAYGYSLAVEREATDRVHFEMLEGMASHQRRALREADLPLLLYAPVCRPDQFISAIGYLIRRLDENTGPENFLRHAFRIEVDNPEWRRLEQAFVASCAPVEQVSETPRRTQNRLTPAESRGAAEACADWPQFRNEPDTDFSLPHHAAWAQAIVQEWWPSAAASAPELPCVIAGQERRAPRDRQRENFDPSRPGVVVARYSLATAQDIDEAVECARQDPEGWRSLSPALRCAKLGEVAEELRKARGRLMGAALANGGKTLLESDPEVSEAVDFVEFYRRSALWFQQQASLTVRPQGVVVVVSPWNFPIAIPCGGIAAALAAGNTVLLKPASDTVRVAWELCECFWRAGISRRVLQFVPCSGAKEGQQLVRHPAVNSVILTGGTQTALQMLEALPSLNLHAETGGKNATIVTALSDREQAIKHVLHSAFSHSGQKCSATSLLLLEAEVYDDPHFKQALCEAVSSLRLGSAWEPQNRLGPLIHPPTGDLERGLKVLEPGESWAVLPRPHPENPNLWSPGVKWDVQPGSFTHLTEFFGPLLAVLRFTTLEEAAAIVNQTGYGLTSGLESLDLREQRRWQELISAGNLYVNRPTTGAIVLRQPFGGCGKSVFGPAMKAGGPNYVAQFMDFSDAAPLELGDDPADPGIWDLLAQGLQAGLLPLNAPDAKRLRLAVLSYHYWWKTEFGAAHDSFRLVGQENLRSYLPVGRVGIRLLPADSPFDLLARLIATQVAGCTVLLSVAPPAMTVHGSTLAWLKENWPGGLEIREELDAEMAGRLEARDLHRLRYAGPGKVAPLIRRAAIQAGAWVADRPVLAEGRIELLWYLREQSLSRDFHRYGNVSAAGRSEGREAPGAIPGTGPG